MGSLNRAQLSVARAQKTRREQEARAAKSKADARALHVRQAEHVRLRWFGEKPGTAKAIASVSQTAKPAAPGHFNPKARTEQSIRAVTPNAKSRKPGGFAPNRNPYTPRT
jgi:hypothetical protein